MVGYNTLEGLVSIIAGLIAGSVSLVGFGLDSFIEVTSGTALLWRLHHDRNEARREAVERITLRIVGSCFIALAVYIAFDSGLTLVRHEKPERSIPGIIVAAVSVVVMPLLARAKRRVAEGIDSAAMRVDSRQTDFCTYLSAILLGGLLLNAKRKLVRTEWACRPSFVRHILVMTVRRRRFGLCALLKSASHDTLGIRRKQGRGKQHHQFRH
jgi:divalent metal cation (Fe/Co/Zn/Cd) transporter